MISFRLMIAIPLLFSTPGCVAAVPLLMQAASGSNAMTQLCSVARLPGQTLSVCDHARQAMTTAPAGKPVSASTVR